MKFRGHETFFIRKGWLYKGMKYVAQNPRIFTDKSQNPMDTLGMGSNMVKSLRYWMQATGLAEESLEKGRGRIQTLTDFGKLIQKRDPYMEEIGTQCLLHYKIASNEKMATSWHFFFNHFQMEEYQREDFVNALRNYAAMRGVSPADSSLEDDFNCIIGSYVSRRKLNPTRVHPESNIESPLDELGLIEIANKRRRIFRSAAPKRGMLHPLIALAIIVEQSGGSRQIPVETIKDAPSNIGRIFHLDIVSLISILDQLDHMGEVEFIRTSGLDVVNIPENLTFSACMEKYYSSLNGQ